MRSSRITGSLILGTLILLGSPHGFGFQTSAKASPESGVRWSVPWAITRTQPGYPLVAGVRHWDVQPAKDIHGRYQHHPQITRFQGRYLAIWSQHPVGEDGPGQQVMASQSTDGQTWNTPTAVFAPLDQIQTPNRPGRTLTAAPFIQLEGRLYAVATVDETLGFGTTEPLTGPQLPNPVRTDQFPLRVRQFLGFLIREVHLDGEWGPLAWIGPEPYQPKTDFPQVPPPPWSETFLAAIQARLDDPQWGSPWNPNHYHALPRGIDGHLLCEPTALPTGPKQWLRYWRDLDGSQRLYVSHSNDGGERWSAPIPTPIPDAPSKSILGQLPDGRYFLVGNQVPNKRGTRRDPLTIGLSLDGQKFETAYAIRWRAPPFQIARVIDRDGRGRGFQYPSCLVAEQSLWIIYSINKEAIAVSQIPLSSLQQPE